MVEVACVFGACSDSVWSHTQLVKRWAVFWHGTRHNNNSDSSLQEESCMFLFHEMYLQADTLTLLSPFMLVLKLMHVEHRQQNIQLQPGLLRTTRTSWRCS